MGYHLGTVWPFDNSIIALGLRRYGFKAEAARIAAGILEAAEVFEGRLPEAKLAAAITQNTRALVRKQRTWFKTQLPPHRQVAAATAGPEDLFA